MAGKYAGFFCAIAGRIILFYRNTIYQLTILPSLLTRLPVMY